MVKQKKSISKQLDEKKYVVYSIVAGALAGLINGIFGGGGGMIIVPILVFLLGKEPKKAHATAILIILPLSITSGLFYAAFGNLDFRVAIPVLIGTIIGGASGAFLLSKLSSRWVIIIFSVVMAAAGIKMLLF